MDRIVPKFSPGCFGSSMTYEETAPVCQACTFAADCKVMHLENLDALRAELGITTKRARAVPPVKSPDEVGVTIPKKTQELIDKLDVGNYRVLENLKNGVNPFVAVGMNYMRVVAHLLMKSANPLGHHQLSFALITAMKCQPTTADSYARQAMQALVHIGVVDTIDGAIKLRK